MRYRQPPNIFTGEVLVSIDLPTSWEYRGLDIHTQYCVQVLGETKHGSGPECYDGCVNVTTDVGRKKRFSNLKNTLKRYFTLKCMRDIFLQKTIALWTDLGFPVTRGHRD